MEVLGSEKGLATPQHQQNDASWGCVGLIRALWKESIANVFGSIARRIFHRPLQVLVMSVSIATICSLGLGWMGSHRYTARMLYLFDVDGNPARVAQARIENAFREKMPQEATVYITPATRAGNLLDKSTLLTVLNLFEKIQDNVTGAPEQFRSKNVCYRPGGLRGLCDAIAIVDYWGKAPRQSIDKDQNIRDTVTRRALAPKFEDLLGRRLEPGSVMGAVTRDASGEITAVKAARMRFRIKNDPNISTISPGTTIAGPNPVADTWQASLIHFIRKSRSGVIHLQVLTDRDTQLFTPVISPFDILLMAIGIGSAVIYSFMVLSRRHTCATSAWLVFANLAVVVLASVCMISISVLAKFYALPAILMSILFLFGMGTASSFFLVTAVSHASSPPAASGSAEAEQAIENAMVGGAGFVSRAALASFLAAGAVLATAGGISDLRFVQKALLQSLLGLGFLFLFEWSFFVACVAINLRGGLRFVLPQMRLHKDGRETNEGLPPVTLESSSDDDKIMRSRLPEALIHPLGFLGMLLVTIGLFTLGVIGSARTRIGFNPEDLVATDEYLRAPISTRDAYFPEGYTPVPFEVVVKFSIPNPWLAISNRHVLNTTKMLSDKLKLNKHVSSVDSWYDAFQNWMPDIGKASVPVFFERLEAFLSTDKGSQYRKDVLYFTSRETMPFIQVSRVTGTLDYPPSANAKLAAMHSLKQLVSSSLESNEERTVWSPAFASWEGLASTKRETPIVLACAATTAFLALAVILFNVAGSVLILGVTAAIMVEVVGFLFVVNRSVNPTTVTVLILGIALSLHSGTFTFVASAATHTPLRLDLLQASWSHAGGAILHSSIAFFLAILPMIGARSLVLRTLFEMWAVTLALGLWHNLVALPLILSLFNFHPSRVTDNNDDGKSEGNGKALGGEEGLLRTLSLKFRPLPRIAPFVTIPEDAVLEGNQSVFTLE